MERRTIIIFLVASDNGKTDKAIRDEEGKDDRRRNADEKC
jgi:hypothetical protein